MKKWRQSLLILGLTAGMTGCGTTDSGPGSMAISSGVDYGETDYELIADPNNELGVKLLADLSETETGNIFISPASLYMALAMLYNGADGVTQDEIAKVLEAEEITPEEMNRANASLMMELRSESDKIQLNVANSLWVKDNYQFEGAFIESSQDYYNAKIESIDVSDPASADAINNWVSEATNDKIEEMVPNPLPGNLVAILLNAIYFKGEWQHPFEQEATQLQPFKLTDGTSEQVPLMRLQAELPYFETESFQAVSLPYGDGEMSMHVFLPNETSSLEEFVSGLDAAAWSEWMEEFHPQEGTLGFPKFELEYEVILNETLEHLGMATAFSSVDLSRMLEESSGLSISEVKQKTYIKVNEEGTEAAAATSIAVEESAPADPFSMEVNRPFFFAITDRGTGVILFMGAIKNPA
ncbi:serpin family protein [Planococcus lenghuensis]|nr:serpin family protein [Planococcus lenghuensis]